MTRRRIEWPQVLEQAATIVETNDGSMSLRQVFYRLVIYRTIPNDLSAYKRLSGLSAEGRRKGTFPALDDRTRSIHQHPTWTSPQAARDWGPSSVQFHR